MIRKTFPFKLKDGKEYVFSERNREDVDYFGYQEALREYNMKFIQKVIVDPDERIPMMMSEMNKSYSDIQIGVFINSNNEMKLKLIYNSFKIENADITFEQFKELVEETSSSELLKLINELERDEPAYDEDVCKELKIDKKKLLEWKKDHPEIYNAVKRELKKKAVITSLKK
jgi:hypothetical protein